MIIRKKLYKVLYDLILNNIIVWQIIIITIKIPRCQVIWRRLNIISFIIFYETVDAVIIIYNNGLKY